MNTKNMYTYAARKAFDTLDTTVTFQKMWNIFGC